MTAGRNYKCRREAPDALGGVFKTLRLVLRDRRSVPGVVFGQIPKRAISLLVRSEVPASAFTFSAPTFTFISASAC
jgi:hypothetical protein